MLLSPPEMVLMVVAMQPHQPSPVSMLLSTETKLLRVASVSTRGTWTSAQPTLPVAGTDRVPDDDDDGASVCDSVDTKGTSDMSPCFPPDFDSWSYERK